MLPASFQHPKGSPLSMSTCPSLLYMPIYRFCRTIINYYLIYLYWNQQAESHLTPNYYHQTKNKTKTNKDKNKTKHNKIKTNKQTIKMQVGSSEVMFSYPPALFIPKSTNFLESWSISFDYNGFRTPSVYTPTFGIQHHCIQYNISIPWWNLSSYNQIRNQ